MYTSGGERQLQRRPAHRGRPSHTQRMVQLPEPSNCTADRALFCSTIGEGGDTMIPSPGRSPKQPLPGIGLQDPLHGRQASPEFNSFHQGVGQICPRLGLFSYRPLPKRVQTCYISSPPQSLDRSGSPRAQDSDAKSRGTRDNVVRLSRSTIGGGGDTMIPPPRGHQEVPSGIGLHDPLHGRQPCLEFNSFHQKVGQICPQGEDYFRAVPS